VAIPARETRAFLDSLVGGRRESTQKLSRLFGNSAELWLNVQRAVDLRDAAQAIKTEVQRIKPLTVA
jgi:antitoxin HigA-1